MASRVGKARDAFFCVLGGMVTIIPILLSHNPHQMLVFRTLFLRGHTNTQYTTVRAAVGEWFGGEGVVALVAAVEHELWTYWTSNL
jgi:hypothetical protein